MHEFLQSWRMISLLLKISVQHAYLICRNTSCDLFLLLFELGIINICFANVCSTCCLEWADVLFVVCDTQLHGVVKEHCGAGKEKRRKETEQRDREYGNTNMRWYICFMLLVLSPSFQKALRWITACQRGSQQRAAKIATHSSFNTSLSPSLFFISSLILPLCLTFGPFSLLSWSHPHLSSGSSVLTAVKHVGRWWPLDPINSLLSMRSSCPIFISSPHSSLRKQEATRRLDTKQRGYVLRYIC